MPDTVLARGAVVLHVLWAEDSSESVTAAMAISTEALVQCLEGLSNLNSCFEQCLSRKM
jgi:hypothetical protein